MIRDILKIRTDNGLGDNNPTFHDIEISEYSDKSIRMGVPDFTATLMWPTPLDNEWTGREYVSLRGERFYIRHTPSGEINNKDGRYKHDIVFTSEYSEILGNTFFEDAVPDSKSSVQSITANKPCTNNTTFKFYGTIYELCDRYNCALLHKGIGDSILQTKTALTTNDTVVGDGFCIVVDPYGSYDKDKSYEFSWEDKKFWDAITEGYNITNIPFERRGRKIIFGTSPHIINHVFKYGHDNELLTVKKNNANAQVINRITMLGSSENIPHYYPNETEYGSITIDTESEANTLAPSNIKIKNPNLFVSKIRANTPVIYKEKVGASATIVGVEYSTAPLTENSQATFTTYKYGDWIDNSPDGSRYEWNTIKVSVNATSAAKVNEYLTITSIMGMTWAENSSAPTSANQNLIASSLIVLRPADSQAKISLVNNSIVITNFPQGNFDIYFDIKVRGKMGTGANLASTYLKWRIASIAIEASNPLRTVWDYDGKTINDLISIGVSIEGTEVSVGDSFEWSAPEIGRLPFQDHLMPPIYRTTHGAERFYNAINVNLLPNTETRIERTYDDNGDHTIYTSIKAYLENGKTYTISGRTNCAWTSEHNLSANQGQPLALLMFIEYIDGQHEWQIVSSDDMASDGSTGHTFTWSKPTGEYTLRVNFYTAGTWWVEKIKLDEGEVKHTQWSPAAAEIPNDPYTDPDTGKPYHFPNPFIEGAPSEHVYRDENVKPTIEEIRNEVISQEYPTGQLFGQILGVAYDKDDSDALKADGDEGDALKYEHSFFYIKIPRFNGSYGFDLFAHASQTDAMTIQMTSGNCNGCKFKIQALEFVDEFGSNYFKNPVQTTGANGDIVSGNYDDKVKKDNIQTWQQDTEANSIWIALQKDTDTFGMIMPNATNGYKPTVGDTFNIINIDLPQGYILAAETRLQQDGMRFMADNNEEKFTFDIDMSRIFFAERPDVLAEIDEYAKLKIEYDNKIYEQFISSFSIDWKDSEPLPEIKVELADEISVGTNFVENTAERAASLISNAFTLGGNLGGSGGSGLSATLADLRYVNKQHNDRTPHRISTDTAFEVGDYVAGSQGGIFVVDPETGQTYIEVDQLRVRMKAIFEELMISKVSSVAGEHIITPGGSIKITFVETSGKPLLHNVKHRCYFQSKNEDEGADCKFIVGDLVKAQQFNIANGLHHTASNRNYWLEVTAVDNDNGYVDLEEYSGKTQSGGSLGDFDPLFPALTMDNPQIGDVLCQLGNVDKNSGRNSAIIFSTVNATAPSITLYDGIVSPSLQNKEVIAYGVDKTDGKVEPFFNCYGRTYIGPKDGSTYIRYTPSTKHLGIKADIDFESTFGDTTLGDYIDSKVDEATTDLGYVLDLTNEVIAVACDSEGNVTGDYTHSQAKVFKGTTQITNDVVFSISSATNITASITNSGAAEKRGIVTLSNLTDDTASVVVKAEIATKVTLYASISIYKVKAGANGADGENGEDGADAVVYSIEPSIDNITKSMSGVLSAQSFTVTKYKTTGNAARVATTDKILRSQRVGIDSTEVTLSADGGTATALVSGITTACTAIILTLYDADGSTVLDKERIPILADASDLTLGTTNLLTNTGRTYTTKQGSSEYDWATYIPSVRTTVNLIQGEMYTIRAKTTGVFTSNHNSAVQNAQTHNGNNYVTLWMWGDGGYQLVSDANTSDIEGTKFIWNNPDGEYFLRLNSYGQAQSISELMLVRGNRISSEWTVAPEDLAYLQQALTDAQKQNTSISGGLILTSLIQMGYTENEAFKVMSGISGLPNLPIAIWAGGNMIDANTDPTNCAKFVIRQDGSAYAANNTIRFLDKRIELGDNLILVDDGIVLMDGGNERLKISNLSIPDEAILLDGISDAINISQSRQCITANSPTRGYTINMVTPVTAQLLNKDLAVGTSLSLTVSCTVGVPSLDNTPIALDDESEEEPQISTLDWEFVPIAPENPNISVISSARMMVEIRKGNQNGDVVYRTVATGQKNNLLVNFKASINFAVQQDTRYYIYVNIVGGSLSGSDVTTGSWNTEVKIQGSATSGIASQTWLGKDGFASVWGNAALVAKGGECMMLSGGFGLKVTSDGIYRKDNGGNWVKM